MTLDSDCSIFLIYLVTRLFSRSPFIFLIISRWCEQLEVLMARVLFLLLFLLLWDLIMSSLLILMKVSWLTRCLCFSLTVRLLWLIPINFSWWDCFFIYMKCFSFYSLAFCLWTNYSYFFLLKDFSLVLYELILSSKAIFEICFCSSFCRYC